MNAITGTVQEISRSAGGKPKCKIAGAWYFMPTDKDTGYGDSPSQGQSIEYRVGQPFKMGDRSFNTIEAWRPLGAQPVQPKSETRAQGTPQAGPAIQIEEAQWRYISNVMAALANAKTLAEPGQAYAWFEALKLASEGKKARAPYDDRLPERTPGSDDDKRTW